MNSILNKIKNVFQPKIRLKNKHYEAAIKLEKESNDLNCKVENFLQNAKEVDEAWRNKWLK